MCSIKSAYTEITLLNIQNISTKFAWNIEKLCSHIIPQIYIINLDNLSNMQFPITRVLKAQKAPIQFRKTSLKTFCYKHFLLSMKPHNKIYKIRSADVRFSWINRFTYIVVSDNVAFIFFSKQNKTFKRHKYEKLFSPPTFTKISAKFENKPETGFDIRRMKTEERKKSSHICCFKGEKKSMSTKKKVGRKLYLLIL